MPWSIFSDGGGSGAAATWAKDQLQVDSQAWGVNVDTPGNEQFLYDWELSEGGGGRYNPLNQGPVPGHPELTTTGSQFGGGAADFASVQAGLQGTLDYLDMPAYAGVKAGLENNDPAAARNALIASPWATSHYGNGANFATAPLPGQTSAIQTDIKTPFGTIPFPGPNVNLTPGGIAGAVTGPVVGEIEKAGAYLLALGAGAALIVAGLYKIANPGTSISEIPGKFAGTVKDTAGTAAMAAA